LENYAYLWKNPGYTLQYTAQVTLHESQVLKDHQLSLIKDLLRRERVTVSKIEGKPNKERAPFSPNRLNLFWGYLSNFCHPYYLRTWNRLGKEVFLILMFSALKKTGMLKLRVK